jgi:hypothetical protein
MVTYWTFFEVPVSTVCPAFDELSYFEMYILWDYIYIGTYIICSIDNFGMSLISVLLQLLQFLFCFIKIIQHESQQIVKYFARFLYMSELPVVENQPFE